MDVDEFRKDLIETVRSRATTEENFIPATFVDEAARRLADAGEIADFVPCHFRGSGYRQRNISLDGYAIDESDNSIRLIISNWSGAKVTPTLNQTEASKQFTQVRNFLEDAFAGRLKDLEASSPASEFVSQLETERSELSFIRIFLVTDATLSTRIKDWPEGEVDGKPIESHIWDINRFHRAFEAASGRDELVVSFETADGGGVPVVRATHEASRFESYLGVLPGSFLSTIYNNFGSRLLEGNVRSFLSLRGGVNKGIRQTILQEPDMFFAYNNGITAVASEAEVISTQTGMQLRWARDFQIVNGGQTTASLAMAARNDRAPMRSISVQMKLSIIPAAESTYIIPKISRFANSQNKVSDADFFSNHEFHRRMEDLSRRIWAPAKDRAQYETHWFYERARGQYVTELARLARAERGQFELQNPRSQLITKTDLAKYENSWLQLPHQVSKGAQKNFVAFAERITGVWERREADFDETYFKRAMCRAIMFKTLEKAIPKEKWYEGDFRAQIVTYTIAKLASMLRESDREIDFEAIWRKQSLSNELYNQLRTIASNVSKVITSPPRGTRNVTEWCKRSDCWEQVQSERLRLRGNL